VPLPTIFLGVKRLASIGEADEKEVESKTLLMHSDDSALIAEFVNSVIVGSQVNANVTSQRIKGSKKNTAQPGYQHHEALAVSVGQDSLASIATALASFNKLMRDHGDAYPGGLLVIDELDVGFHPHAIDRLAKALKTFAKRLKLQLIATTHSPRLIEAIHPDGDGDLKAPDAVVYLLDTRTPRLAEDQSLLAVLADMSQRDSPAAPKKPVVHVYFEDDEGAQFCSALLSSRKRGALGRKFGVQIKLVPLGVGGSNLINLPDKDPLFNDRVLIVDADTSIPKKAVMRGNTLKLPCVNGAGGTNRSPENTIKNFLRNVAEAGDEPLRKALLKFDIANPSSDRILTTFFSDDAGQSSQRTSSKNWWKDHWTQFEAWGVIREWGNFYPDELRLFHTAFESAVEKVAKRLGQS
jgi:AAA domain, putative AbiEii toxin, Type IV TA system